MQQNSRDTFGPPFLFPNYKFPNGPQKTLWANWTILCVLPISPPLLVGLFLYCGSIARNLCKFGMRRFSPHQPFVVFGIQDPPRFPLRLGAQTQEVASMLDTASLPHLFISRVLWNLRSFTESPNPISKNRFQQQMFFPGYSFFGGRVPPPLFPYLPTIPTSHPKASPTSTVSLLLFDSFSFTVSLILSSLTLVLYTVRWPATTRSSDKTKQHFSPGTLLKPKIKGTKTTQTTRG